MADQENQPQDVNALTDEILQTADRLGELVAKHPSVQKLADAQEAIGKDPAAQQLLQQFDQKLQVMARNEQHGQPVSPSERQEIEALQQQLASDIKIKAFSMAQVDLTDLLRKVSQAWQKPVAEAQGQDVSQGGPGGPGGPGGGPAMGM